MGPTGPQLAENREWQPKAQQSHGTMCKCAMHQSPNNWAPWLKLEAQPMEENMGTQAS